MLAPTTAPVKAASVGAWTVRRRRHLRQPAPLKATRISRTAGGREVRNNLMASTAAPLKEPVSVPRRSDGGAS